MKTNSICKFGASVYTSLFISGILLFSFVIFDVIGINMFIKKPPIWLGVIFSIISIILLIIFISKLWKIFYDDCKEANASHWLKIKSWFKFPQETWTGFFIFASLVLSVLLIYQIANPNIVHIKEFEHNAHSVCPDDRRDCDFTISEISDINCGDEYAGDTFYFIGKFKYPIMVGKISGNYEKGPVIFNFVHAEIIYQE